MYAIYKKASSAAGTRYEFIEQISLFGCNVGWIPRLLRKVIPPGQPEPFEWHLVISDALSASGRPGQTFMINLKPNNRSNLSLYEIADVWGYSDSDWTPIMLRLRALFIDDDAGAFDAKSFERSDADISDPVFSMMYLVD
jgi:hypothetical protein